MPSDLDGVDTNDLLQEATNIPVSQMSFTEADISVFNNLLDMGLSVDEGLWCQHCLVLYCWHEICYVDISLFCNFIVRFTHSLATETIEITGMFWVTVFSARTLSHASQEGHQACKNSPAWAIHASFLTTAERGTIGWLKKAVNVCGSSTQWQRLKMHKNLKLRLPTDDLILKLGIRSAEVEPTPVTSAVNNDNAHDND